MLRFQWPQSTTSTHQFRSTFLPDCLARSFPGIAWQTPLLFLGEIKTSLPPPSLQIRLSSVGVIRCRRFSFFPRWSRTQSRRRSQHYFNRRRDLRPLRWEMSRDGLFSKLKDLAASFGRALPVNLSLHLSKTPPLALVVVVPWKLRHAQRRLSTNKNVTLIEAAVTTLCGTVCILFVRPFPTPPLLLNPYVLNVIEEKG